MNKVKIMIESSPTKLMAINMLETWRVFGKITETQYKSGRKLIKQE